MSLKMPEIDAGTIARRAEIIAAMRILLPEGSVITEEDSLRVYESDGLTAYRQLPLIVVLPETTAEVVAIMRYCSGHKIRIVPRGAGTGLSGGALPLADAITIGLGKFKHIVDIDLPNRVVRAQAGVTNLAITQAVEHVGFYYAPRPLQPDRLHHRRQRRREFRRRALP